MNNLDFLGFALSDRQVIPGQRHIICPCNAHISTSVVCSIFFPAVLLFFMFLRLVSSPKKKYCNQYISIRIQFLNSRKKKELCTQNLRGKVYCRKKTVLHYLSFHVSNPKPKKELYNHYYSGTPFFNGLISTSWEAFKGSWLSCLTFNHSDNMCGCTLLLTLFWKLTYCFYHHPDIFLSILLFFIFMQLFQHKDKNTETEKMAFEFKV